MTARTRVNAIEHLYRLPVAPEKRPGAPPVEPSQPPLHPIDAIPAGRRSTLQALSKLSPIHFDDPGDLKTIKGPRSLRLGLDLSLAEMAKLLALYVQRHYSRSALHHWELPERGEPMPAQFRMADATREAYDQIVRDLVTLATDGRRFAWYHHGWRRWMLRARCGRCGGAFSPRTTRQLNCRRCAPRGRAKGSQHCTSTSKRKPPKAPARKQAQPQPRRAPSPGRADAARSSATSRAPRPRSSGSRSGSGR